MKTDVAIIGGGPAGSTASMYLTREGISSVVIEKESFPRYHVGESMTGECGAIVRDLGLEDEMIRRGHALKYGVTVYGAEGKNSWWVPVKSRDANGELQDQFTWQVMRSDFDQMMLQEAIARGGKLVEGQAVSPLLNREGVVNGVQVRTDSGLVEDIEADVVLDCTGAATFLANAGVTGAKYRGNYDRQLAIFSQVKGSLRGSGSTRETYKDNTLIFYKDKYHWAWFIPLNDEVVSVGVVAPSRYFLQQKESKMDFLKRELVSLNPELSWRMQDVTFIEEAHAVVNYSYQISDFAGPGFMCLGDAHRFIDPIFSFGLYVAMKEAQFASQEIKQYLAGGKRNSPNPFAGHMVRMEKGIDILEDALDAFWDHSLAFAAFVHYRYTEDMVDIFAGRIFDREEMPANQAFLSVLKRERNYDVGSPYSVPIGSRYDLEKATMWEAHNPIE